MEIREATAKDADQIAHVSNLSFRDAYHASMTPNALEDSLRKFHSATYLLDAMNESTILVAEVDDQIVGYIKFEKASRDFDGVTDEDLDLDHLYVLPTHYSRGIGRALFEAMLAHDRAKNARNIYLDVWDGNEKALNMYAGQGFELTGHRDDFEDDDEVFGADEVLVKKLR